MDTRPERSPAASGSSKACAVCCAAVPSLLLVTDDHRVCELAIPPEYAGDVYAFVVEAMGEDDLEYEDVLVSERPPALMVAVYTTCTLRQDVAVRNELASMLLGRSVFGPAALVCLEGLPPAEAEAEAEAEAQKPNAEPARFQEFSVVAAETMARQFAERGRPVPEGGAKIGFPRPFGDIFFAICVRQFYDSRQQGARARREVNSSPSRWD
jgi:hypothetical protein